MDQTTDIHIVYIRWIDHWSTTLPGWINFDSIPTFEPVTVCSAGYLVKETDDAYFITSTISEDANFIGLMSVLKSCVKDIKHLKIPRR